MGKGRGPGRPFEKGKTGNPKGRPQLPIDLKQARTVTKLELERILNRFLTMTAQELAAAMTDPRTTVLEAIVLTIATKALQGGDQVRLNFLLDRLIGKVQEPTQQHAVFNFTAMPRAQAIALGEEALAYLKRTEAEGTYDGEDD